MPGGGGNLVAWLPDGRILFGRYSDSITESDLWEISLDTTGSAIGQPVRLTNTTGSYVYQLSASADGKRLAYIFARFPFSIFLAKLNQARVNFERPLRLTNDSWNNWPMAWTSDGQALFYVSARPTTSLYKCNVSTGSTELFAGGAENYRVATVSPDGAWLIATAIAKETSKRRLVRIPLSGGAPEAVLTISGPAGVQCAFHGTRTCVMDQAVGKKVVFSSFDPVGGRLEELATIQTIAWPAWLCRAFVDLRT